MPAQSVGLSFMPPTSADPMEQRATSSALGPSQRALQILSLRLPRILGNRAIAPSSLLTPKDTAGPSGVSPESAVLQSALRAMTGGQTQARITAPGLIPDAGQPEAPRFAMPRIPAADTPTPIQATSPELSSLVEQIVQALTANRSSESGGTTPNIAFSGPPAPEAAANYNPTPAPAEDPYARQAPTTAEPTLVRRAARRI